MTEQVPRSAGMPAVAVGTLCILAAVILNDWTIARLLGVHNLEQGASRVYIWTGQIVAALVGFLLIRYRARVRRVYLLAAPIPLLAMLILVEGATRHALALSRSGLRELSPELGWKTSENVRMSYTHPAFGPVVYTTVQHGFRRFGALQTSKTKVLVLGDSFTQAWQVSNGQAYYDHLADGGQAVEIFAWGGGGYGSLQEYMILDRYIDTIRPDLILWQLSANDLIDNDHELEIRSPLPARMVRPYYEHGRIEYHFASANLLARYSQLLQFIGARVAMLRGQGFDVISLERERTRYPQLLARSIRTTGDIMGLVRRRAGAIPVIAFQAEREPFADSVYRALTVEHGWDYIPGVADSVAAEKAAGKVVDGLPRDGHWNRTGHAIAGRVILEYLVSRRLLSGASRH